MKVYLAGPMSHIPYFNFPAFDAAAAKLRAAGYVVVNPAEEDSPEVQKLARASHTGDPADLKGTGESWGSMLGRDVAIVADDVDGVVLLPGWHRSRGAILEATTALLCGKPCYPMEPGQELAPLDLRSCLPHLIRRAGWCK